MNAEQLRKLIIENLECLITCLEEDAPVSEWQDILDDINGSVADLEAAEDEK